MNEVENRAFKTTGNILVFGTEELNHGNLLHQWNKKKTISPTNRTNHQCYQPTNNTVPILSRWCRPQYVSPLFSLRYWISSFAIPPKFLWIKQGKEKKNYIYRYTIPWKQHRLTEPLCQNCKSIPLAIFPVFLTHNWGKRKSKGKKWEINIRGQHSKNLELLYSIFRGIQITGHCIAVLNTCSLLSHV